MSRNLRFKLEPNNSSLVGFILFMNNSKLKIELNSETNVILVEINEENPTEIEKLLNKIDRYFKIIQFSSGQSAESITAVSVEKDSITVMSAPEENSSSSVYKNRTQDSILYEEFEHAFEMLSKTGNLNQLFEELHIENQTLQTGCSLSLEISKINWDSLNEELSKKKITHSELKNAFKEWLDTKPDLKEKCPTLYCTTLFKVIKKYYKK